LPRTTIPFRHSRFLAQTRIAIDRSATLLYGEILMPGRKYYGTGELFEYDLFSSTVRAERLEGTPLFTEKLLVEPTQTDLRQIGMMGRYDVFANVLLLTPLEEAERIFAKIEAVKDDEGRCMAAASRLPGGAGLIYKVLGAESRIVGTRIREFWSLVRGEVRGARVPNEFLWG
jgi:urease accessory protein